MQTRGELLERLKNTTDVFRDTTVAEAFVAVDRAHFLPKEYEDEAYEDYAIMFPPGITSLQPTATCFMLELLQFTREQKVLIVGVRTGWLTALVASAVGPEGDVYVTEASQDNVDRAEINLQPYGFENIQIFPAAENIGLQEHGPYDRILVSRALPAVPEELVDQLRYSGILVVPTENGLVQVTKNEDGDTNSVSHEGVVVPPLVYDVVVEE